MTNPDPAATTPHSVSSPFFVTGGTLPLDAASYVARIADEELYQSLRRGEFCYVLNTRQMGKSSLMIRAAQRLREDGKQVVVLDLTGAGQNLSVEQWYFGLLDLVAMQTRREDELVAFWKTHRELGPMQRFVAALQRVLLTPQEPTPSQEPLQRTADGDREQTQSSGAGELVIFIDEIDAVRSLPFSADEFFAGIRECCNRNAQNSTGRRLVFCLLGVATPSDLIRDTRVTPFNVGRRIELRDFTREEAAPLAEGLRHNRDAREATALLDRVLYWTGGHPYMTQRLCRAVAESLAAPGQSGNSSGRGRDEIEDAALVDTLCQTLFLAKSARETDDNLAFVRTRLLHNEEGRAALLDLYGQARRGKRVKDDETNPLCPVLRLSGVVKASDGRLVVRNEIYARVFDAAWIAEYMPDAEIRRQKRAFRLGVVRAAVVFGSLTIVIGALLFVAVINAKRARAAETEARKQAAYAREQEQNASHFLYDMNMDQLKRDWEMGNFTVSKGLLEETKGSPARGFEWDYWNRLQSEYAAPLSIETPYCTVIAPDNRTLGVVVKEEQSPEKGLFTARDIATGIARFSTPARCIWLAYAPDGSRLLLCVGKTVEVRDARNGRLLQTVPAQQEDVLSFQFTADSAAILVARTGGLLTLWDCHTEKTLWERKIPASDWVCIATSDKRAATITGTGVTQSWDIKTGDELYRNDRNFNCGPMAFSPDNRFLVGRSRVNEIEILDLSTRKIRNLLDNSGTAYSYHFSPDGRRLMVGYAARICTYDMPSGRLLSDPPKSSTGFPLVLLSPNGRFALRAERDDKLHFVPTTPPSASLRLIPPAAPHILPNGKSRRAALWTSRYSPDGRQLAAPCEDGNVYLWDTRAGKLLRTLRGDGVEVRCVAFSHDGGRLVVGDKNGRVSLWELRSGRRLVQFRAHITPDTHIPGQTGMVEDVGFTPDDRQILTAGEDHTAKVWDLAAAVGTAPTLNLTLQGHTNSVESFLLSPDGATLLTASDDRTAKLWERRTGRLLHTFKSSAEIWGAAFSPDGRQIALANLYKTIEVWDIRAQRKLHILSGHLAWVTQAAFSPDGKRIVSGSVDKTIKIWDAQTGRELLTLRGHTQQITGVAFAPNGRQIATSACDGEVRLWNTDTAVPDTAAENP